MVRELSKGKKVLDLFCYSGGFAMNAARGGAAKVSLIFISSYRYIKLN